jgi:toxin ParE1/3/4
MTKKILLRPRASQDLDDHFLYLSQSSVEIAFRFFDSARSIIAQLARMPGMGNLYPVENPKLKGLRKWAIKDFRKYLIFYFERDDAIEVIRILYATQDISSILESENLE